MNLNSIIDRDNTNESSDSLYADLGFKDYKRQITLFLKESKNINGIVGHNLVTKISGTVTNYSIVDKWDSRILFKTVYVCDIEFPARITIDMIKRDINSFISIAKVVPFNAFTNIYVITKHGFIDLGLSIADLTEKHPNILNLSKNEDDNRLLHDLVYGHRYNPKYYNYFDCNALWDDNDYVRSSLICDLYDVNTKIVYNSHGEESLDCFTNNIKNNQITTTVLGINGELNEIFGKIILNGFDSLEFVYRSSDDSVNITKLSMFTKMRDDIKDYLYNQTEIILREAISNLNEKTYLKSRDYYIVFSIDSQFAIANMFWDNRSIRIVKPVSKMYSEFSIDNSIIDYTRKADKNVLGLPNIQNQLNYIQQSVEAISNLKGASLMNDIQQIINIADNASKAIGMISSFKDIHNANRQISNMDSPKCLGQKLYLKNPNE